MWWCKKTQFNMTLISLRYKKHFCIFRCYLTTLFYHITTETLVSAWVREIYFTLESYRVSCAEGASIRYVCCGWGRGSPLSRQKEWGCANSQGRVQKSETFADVLNIETPLACEKERKSTVNDSSHDNRCCRRWAPPLLKSGVRTGTAFLSL